MNMTIIAYAQNCEDVLLWRALGHVENGFYVDIGAWSPDEHSVTKLFYEKMWHGVNVEPLPTMFAELLAHRPNDINLFKAVSDIPGQVEFYNIENTGLSTFDSDAAERAKTVIETCSVSLVEVITLADIWRCYIPQDQDVHFLKVDVEGFEEKVLRGSDWKIYRPWIVVVEATVPLTPKLNHQSWEPILIESGYKFVWFDGLNRYYVAKEHGHLEDAFCSQPNVFDDYRSIEAVRLEERALTAEALYQASKARIKELETLHAEIRRDIPLGFAPLKRYFKAKLAPLRKLNEGTQRSLLSRLVLGHSGKPSWLVRRVLFHTSGKPRRFLKRMVFHKDGRPRERFRNWIFSSEYQSLRSAVFPKTRYPKELSSRAIEIKQKLEAMAKAEISK